VSITKKTRGCAFSALLWFPLSTWHQYATPVLADEYKGAGRKRGSKTGWNNTKWDSMLMLLLLLWTPMAKLRPCRSLYNFFSKKILMQQWRKLRPVSIDGFMALNIINIADMIRREKDEVS